MRTLEFTEDQMKNLAVFLNRVQLSGAEVPAYIEIVQEINESVLEIVSREEITPQQKKDVKIKSDNKH